MHPVSFCREEDTDAITHRHYNSFTSVLFHFLLYTRQRYRLYHKFSEH